ncbi:MAG: sugar ABC transporter permease [Anaerolineae bacterium]|jgi:multiple sugar transport system permease protein
MTETKTGTTLRSTRRRQLSDAGIAWLFILPTLLLLFAFSIYPFLRSLYISFTEYSVVIHEPPVFVGLKNYIDILTDEQLWIYFGVTGRYAVVTVALETLVGFGLAMLVRQRFKGSGFITTLMLVPMMLSPVVVGMFWRLMFDPGFGIFNYMIGIGRAGPDWLASPQLAFWAVVIVDVWMWSPFVMLLCLSGLRAIPDYLYEAAAIDRASSWFQFWRITVPQVAPMLLVAVMFRVVEAIKAFDLVWVLTRGGPGDATELIAINLYRQAFLGQFRTGRAAALAYLIWMIIIGLSSVLIATLNKIRGE